MFKNIKVIILLLSSYFCHSDVCNDTLDGMLKELRVQEKIHAVERLSFVSSSSYASNLIMMNHQLLHHSRNVRVSKKIGLTAMNVIATPMAFVADAVVGPVNKDIIEAVNQAVKSSDLSNTRKAVSVGASALFFPFGVVLGYLYRIGMQLPTTFSAGATYLGGAFNDFRRTAILIKQIKKGKNSGFVMGRLAKKISTDERRYTKEETAKLLKSALDTSSFAHKRFMVEIDDEFGAKSPNDDKYGSYNTRTEAAKRVKAPIGLDQMALLLKIATRGNMDHQTVKKLLPKETK